MHRVWAASHKGYLRARNEDYYDTSSVHAEASAPSSTCLIDPKSGWVLVADGMGGHAGGDVASLLAVSCLRTVIADITTEQDARYSVDDTNLALHEAMRQQAWLKGMGTTVAGLRFIGNTAICFNVGDSRIYVNEGSTLRQVSEDHVVDGHYLTQCLGGLTPAPLDTAVSVLAISQSSRFLLCTDGLTDLVSDELILDHLAAANPAEELVAAALVAGGIDNVTVVVVEVSTSI